MGEQDDLFFVARNGAVWACWLSGKPAVNLGSEAEVRSAMAQFSVLAGADPEAAVHSIAPRPTPGAVKAEPAVRAENERLEERHDLTILGRVFAPAGRYDVTVLDLSEHGCRFYHALRNLKQGHSLTIKIGTVGPIAATVKWSRGQYVGVQFDTPLYPSVMEHIREQFDLRRK